MIPAALTDTQAQLAVAYAAFAAIMLVWYVLGRFSYDVAEQSVRMTWRILWWVPIVSTAVEFRRIRHAWAGHFLSAFGGDFVGNIFGRRGVWLELRRTTLADHFWKRIYITPEDPDAFASEINRRIKQLEAAEHA